MYLQTELTNKAKELYFKYLKEEGFLKIDFKEHDHLDVGSIITSILKLDLPVELKVQIACIYDDLFQVLTNDIDENSVFLSSLANNTNHKVKIAEKKVKQSICTLSKESKELIDILKQNFDENSYIVGGFVRDAIADRKPNDVDFCTSISYAKLKEVFKKYNWETKDTGKQFLVLNVTHPFTKENFEIAALRSDKDNEGAKVGTIEEDAQRRDFVNSCIYFSLKEEKLIDPSGKAIKDCQENRLRFMGKAKDRIQEDPLRCFRAYRMISRGWEPEAKTLKAVRENFEFAINNVAPMRVQNEIEKMIGIK